MAKKKKKIRRRTRIRPRPRKTARKKPAFKRRKKIIKKTIKKRLLKRVRRAKRKIRTRRPSIRARRIKKARIKKRARPKRKKIARVKIARRKPGRGRHKKTAPRGVKRKRIAPSSLKRYILNPNHEFYSELRSLVLKSSPAEKERLIRKILRLGRIRLAVISGIFLNSGSQFNGDGSVSDLFIVGDDIDRKKLRLFLRSLEAEVGREVRFAIMEKDEFEYRLGMFDRFVRVLLEGPHEKIINKLGI